MWNIIGIVKRGDYLNAIVPDHPNATRHGYVLLHRVIMENAIGRILTELEIVHHKDHDRFNNDISNLELMSREEHSRIHGFEQLEQWVLLQCPNCGCLFERSVRNTHWIKRNNLYTACSRSCSGYFSHLLYNLGFNDDYIQSVLNNNFQYWFLLNNQTGETIDC